MGRMRFKDIHAGVSVTYEQIEHEYFLFLCRLAGMGVTNNYSLLLSKLQHTEFIFFVPNDDNRAVEGVALRDVFSEEVDLDFAEWAHIYRAPCSVLEMMLALAYRMTGIVGIDDNTKWFWEMIYNLGFEEFTDDEYYFKGGHAAVGKTLELFMERRIDENGNGGLFPLRNPKENQREIEIWYQMNHYLSEKYDMGY